MSQVTLEVPFEKVLEIVQHLSEEEKERLFFTVNEDYARALDELRKEAWEEHQQGRSISLEDLNEI